MSWQIDLRDHVDAQIRACLLQRSPLFLGIGRISLIVFIMEIIIRIDQFLWYAGMLDFRFQRREHIAFQAMESGMILHRTSNVAVVIIIDVQVILIHLVPEHDLGIILQLLETIRRTRHIEHDAADLIGRIITGDPLRHAQMILSLIQDLFHGNRSIKTADISRRIDPQTIIISDHQIPFIPNVITVFAH